MSNRTLLTARPWVEVEDNGLLRVTFSVGDVYEGAYMQAYLTERAALDLIQRITKALDSRPRVASAADLGIGEAA